MIRAIVRLAIHNPVLLNLLFVAALLMGAAAFYLIPKEEFPRVDTDQVGVTVVWPGASPEDLEDLVIRPIEERLDEVDDVKHVYGTALENMATVRLEFERGTDSSVARQQVEQAVGSVDGLPDDASAPRVYNIARSVPLAHVAVAGDATRRDVADTVAADLAALPGVREVEIRGDYTRVLRVQLDPAAATARGLGPAQVAQAIEAAVVGAPAGAVDLQGQRVLVRTPKAFDSPEVISDVPVIVRDGLVVRVGDVAHVAEDWEPPVTRFHVNGQPAIELIAHRQLDADALKIVPSIQRWASAYEGLPPGLELAVYDDGARVVEDRIWVLAQNGVVGIVLVVGCLVLFIGFRNSMLVAWGLPVAYSAAIVCIYFWGMSINVISSFALLIVSGIIVDDAIIITENVQRHLEEGKSRTRAAIDGTVEVFPAVFAATLTTCLAFAPLGILEGLVGRIMAIVPTVVIFSLLASLFEAFFVLPGHLAHFAREHPVRRDNLATRSLRAGYRPVLAFVTGRFGRYLSFAGVLVLLALSGLVASGMRTTLTTDGNPYFVWINLELPTSASADQTRTVAADIEQFVQDEGGELLVWQYTTTGRQAGQASFPTMGANVAQVKVGFKNNANVWGKVPTFLDKVRVHLNSDPRIKSSALRVMQGGPPSGEDVDIKVRSADPAAILPVVRELESHLRERPGVADVRDDAGEGTETFAIHVQAHRARLLGLTEAQVVQVARGALDGVVAAELSVAQRATEVRVSYRGADTFDMDRIADLPLLLPNGTSVRLRQVATLERVRGVRSVERVDGQRVVRITADVDDAVSTPEIEQKAFEAAYADLVAPGTSLFVGGALADSAESFGQLPWALGIAFLLVYLVLAVQFRSYVQPVIILFAVPLGLAGVVLGLATLGMDLSFIAAIGAVGLIGIVVNDSLVLVDFINRQRRDGATAAEAVTNAGLLRLRPIVLTTITTVLGLGPLAIGLAGREPLLAPMAASISFGLAFATALTLVAIPAFYLIMDDLGRLFRPKRPEQP